MSDGARAKAVARRALVWVIGGIVSAAFYLLLIDNTDLPELLVGAGAAVIAATGFLLGREQYLTAETIRSSWLRRLWRPLLKVPGDSLTVCVMALRQVVRPRAVQGEFRAIRFRCREDEPLQAGRSALAESAGSLAPNTFIVGIDPERELMLCHQLRRTGGDEALDVLGLG
jgi:hypothetical protein